MEEIKIMPKPEWISWDEVQECIYLSQQTNTKKGFDMLFGHSTGSILQKSIGDGYCFVALNSGNKVVGTISLTISALNTWWHKGKAGLQCYEAVLPEYRGTDVFFDLHEIIDNKERELGLKVLWATTAEQNKVVRRYVENTGWKIVQLSSAPRRGTYFSVIMVKWINGCPFSDSYIKLMFSLSKFLVRLKFKVTDAGKINRFFFWK